MIIIPKLRVGYQNVPKIATTSLFDWLYGCCLGSDSIDLAIEKNEIRKYFLQENDGISIIENTSAATEHYDDFYKFAVTRDPVKRFLSMYSNRVVHYRELSPKGKNGKKVLESGLDYDPEINELVKNFDAYLKVAKSVWHHSKPMMDFMGPDLTTYDRLVDISQLGMVMDELSSFWKKEGLIKSLDNMPKELPRKQTGGPKFGLEVLNAESFEYLLSFYREDYDNIPTVSLSGIKDSYMEAVKNSDNNVDKVYFDIRDYANNNRKNINRYGAWAEGNDNKDIEGDKEDKIENQFKVKKFDSSLVDLVRVRVENIKLNGAGLSFQGVVVLKPDVEFDEFKIIIARDSEEQAVTWGLNSPKVASQHPDNPNSQKARFKSSKIKPAAGEVWQLLIQGSDEERHVLANIKLTS